MSGGVNVRSAPKMDIRLQRNIGRADDQFINCASSEFPLKFARAESDQRRNPTAIRNRWAVGSPMVKRTIFEADGAAVFFDECAHSTRKETHVLIGKVVRIALVAMAMAALQTASAHAAFYLIFR